jgi:hypothetical protein
VGTSGAALFHDDTALDVRDQYRALLALGRSDPEVVASIRGERDDQDEEESAVIALALAAVQWEYGRLDDEIRERALEVIDSGLDLRRWEGSPLLEKRRNVLGELRAKLLSPQPKRRTPRRSKPVEVPAHHALSPEGQARATAFQLSGAAAEGGPRTQVLIEQAVNGSRGGGGVFVVRCAYHDVTLKWLDGLSIEISYPGTAEVEVQADQSYYYGRIVTVRYTTR